MPLVMFCLLACKCNCLLACKCKVAESYIKKALEVVRVELKAEMVKELDGSVMKCVRDQNSNHVIQKCIECVPQHLIQFIILSFVGHVVTLSTHPYNCRFIQRVLQLCADPKTKQILVDEILGYVCNLAQDQYGSYVIQVDYGLHEMRLEHAEIKFTADAKLDEANLLVTTVEDEPMEVESKNHAADAKFVEA